MNVDAALERMMDEEFAGATHDSTATATTTTTRQEANISPAVRAPTSRRRRSPPRRRSSLAERLAAKHNIKVTGAARPAATASAAAPATARLDRAGASASTARASPPRTRPYDPPAAAPTAVAARPVAAARPARRQAVTWRRGLDSQPAVAARIPAAPMAPQYDARPACAVPPAAAAAPPAARPLLGGACGLLDAAPPSAPPAAPARAPSVGAYFGATQTAAPTAAAAAATADPYAYGQRAADAAPTGAAAGAPPLLGGDGDAERRVHLSGRHHLLGAAVRDGAVRTAAAPEHGRARARDYDRIGRRERPRRRRLRRRGGAGGRAVQVPARSGARLGRVHLRRADLAAGGGEGHARDVGDEAAARPRRGGGPALHPGRARPRVADA